MHVHQIKIHPG